MALKTLSAAVHLPAPFTSHRKPVSLRPPRTLKPPPSFSTPHPIFLPHLETHHPEPLQPDGDDEEEEEEELDPIVDFFKSRPPRCDPTREGRLSLQRNRRTSWHLADPDDDDDEVHESLEMDSPQEEEAAEEEVVGTVGEVLRIARHLGENATLGELLGPYEGRIGERECVELLSRMGEEGLFNACLYLYEWMGQQEPSLVTPRACTVLFPVLGRAKMGRKLVTMLENLPQSRLFRDVHVYNATISALSCCNRYDDAWRVYEALEANNIQPDHVTCSVLITVMRKNGHSARDAWQFFERMNRKGVKWSLEVFGALMKSFCDEGLKKEALIIQSEMEKKGILSNAIIYNTLMDAYSKSNQVEEAEGLFCEMKEKGLKPTVATYNVLMDAYSRRIQPEVIEDLLIEMQELGLKPNVKSYTCLISAYGRQRKMSDMASDSFLRMKKAGIKPSPHSYTALIHAYSVCGWHEKAHATYESMVRDGITPSVETYTALLDAFRRAGDSEKLMEIWKSMIKNKVEGTKVTFNILLDGLAKQGLYVQARDVVSEFGRIGLQPTVITFNMLMNAYARGGQHSKLPQLLKEMASLNLKPDSVTYSTMIYAYVRVRDFTRAFYYHKQMVQCGQIPEVNSYRKLRAILDEKAGIRNRRDKSAMLGIVNSNFGIKRKKGNKDEFWKDRKKRSMIKKVIGGRK